MIVRKAGVADVATLVELRGIEPDKLAAYADWVAAHAQTHLPFVAEVDGYVVGVAWLLLAERVPGNESLDRRYGDVQAVMVREDYRNNGVGGALMAAILAEAPHPLPVARDRPLRPPRRRLPPAQRIQPPPPAPALGAGRFVIESSTDSPHTFNEFQARDTRQ
jgi:GNAT superfamily N-acetyltransferase